MPKYSYSAFDSNGKQKKGTIIAFSDSEANSKLSSMGLMPTKVVQLDESIASPNKKKDAGLVKIKKKSGIVFGKVIKQQDLTIFTRQIAILIQAGLPLLRSLEVMIRQEKNIRFKAVLEQIAEYVKSGGTFSDALAQHPKIFEKLFINMVRAGEVGGVLDVVLSRLAGFMEKSQRTKKKVKSAMVYPIVVVSVAIAIVVLLMIVVVPKFQSIFEDMLSGASLPGPTQLVINVSNFISGNFVVTLIGLIVFFVGGKYLLKTEIGSKISNWFALNIPKLGDLVRKVNIARITRTFGTLLSSGVPILQSITITRDITGNIYFSNALNRVHNSIRDGESLSAPMERESVFPSMVTSMVDVGEETGELSEMLNRIADNYDEDVDNAVASITSIIEPVMIVFLALVVGFIVIALFLPIVEIIKQIS
ncbi:MAG: type II secretion system F family protein [Verrucomicrobiota bacterium]|nr:type II secretion system F family protein [Verrucomicrobiota bacterium]